MQMKAPRILLVEDDADLRESTLEGLTLSGFQTSGVGSGREFYRALDNDGPFTVAIIDIGLPDQSGLVLAQYCRANTSMGIIILTAHDSDEDHFRGYEAGCDLYLTKPFSNRALASAISRMVERLSAQQPLAENGARNSSRPPRWALDRNTWSLLTPSSGTISLTAREMELLTLLLETPGETVAREHLLQRLYPRIDEYTGRALDALLRRLRAKTERSGCEPLPVKTVHGVGYCLSEPFSLI